MKRFGSIALVMLMLVGYSAYSQQGQQLRGNFDRKTNQVGNFECRIPNLTDDQKQKINDLRVKHIKEVTPLKNEMGEKKARLRTLESVDKPDLNAINKTIDEMASIRAQIMKKNAAHRVEVASLLTDEQKVFFQQHKGKKSGKGMRQGDRRGMGQGNGMGSHDGMGGCGFGPSNME
ncbi:MAG: Spy/CpxP family protein refolding chaperone [Bacteroidales bacterium]